MRFSTFVAIISAIFGVTVLVLTWDESPIVNIGKLVLIFVVWVSLVIGLRRKEQGQSDD